MQGPLGPHDERGLCVRKSPPLPLSGVRVADGDDEWFPQKLESQLRTAQQSPLPFLRKACQYGRPTALDVLLYLGIWLTPQKARNQIRVGFQKRDRQLLT
jgi:hypothetical protein